MKIVNTILSTTAPAASKRGNSVVVTHEKQRVVALEVPAEGGVASLTVKQTAGTNKAFAVELLNSEVPLAVGEHAIGATPASPVELYRVIAPLAGLSGAAAVFRVEHGQSYRNADGGPADQQRYLYVVIIPTSSADDTTWDVSLTTWEDVG